MSDSIPTNQRQAAAIDRSWRLVCLFVVDIFLFRGMALLAILPPFEGWDEYQHLARIAYVAENGRSPTMNESVVPRSMFPAITALPHCSLDTEQSHRVGALPYLANDKVDPPIRSYWDGPPPAPVLDAPDIRLYQAQHGPLYYWLMTPVYKALWDPAKPMNCIFALRIINLAFGAGALVAAMWAMGRLVTSVRQRIWIALLLAFQPLFLLNIARIANDAAAVCLGIAATGLLLVHGRRGMALAAIAAGVLAGLAVLAKSVALVILPLGLAAPLVGLWRRETTTPRVIRQSACFFVAFFLVTGTYFFSNWKAYGVAVPMQESIKNKLHNRGLADTLAVVGQIDWWRQFRSRVMRDSLWVGGWSFLTLPSAFRGIHEGLVVISLAGLIVALIRRRRSLANGPGRNDDVCVNAIEPLPRWLDLPSAALMALMIAGGLGGLAYHTIQSKLAYDSITTNVWYACLAFPWMIVLLVFGANGLRDRVAATWVGAMLLLCVVAEWVGLFVVMPRGYTGLNWSDEAKERLASVHPGWLVPDLAMPLEFSAIILAIGVFCVSIWNVKFSPASHPKPSVPPRDPAR